MPLFYIVAIILYDNLMFSIDINIIPCHKIFLIYFISLTM